MSRQKPRGGLLLTALSLAAAAVALTAATYAWFTFDPSTTVTPMEGSISAGDTNLLISESRSGPFDRQCPLHPTELAETLRPVSTADLSRFYTALAQDRDGYSIAFREAEELSQYLIHGTVYLQCLGGSCDVYFQQPALDLGDDPQVLAAGRLGLRITGGSDTRTLLLRLDALGSTAGAESRETVYASNAVIGGLDRTAPLFETDPAEPIEAYLYGSGNRQRLCGLNSGEIAEVEYWLYLEGCDPECFNPVQSRDMTLRLGFAGDSGNG